MLGIEVRPVWKRKQKSQSVDTTVSTIPTDVVVVAEEAIERLALKMIIGAVIVTGTTIVLTTAGKIIETAFENHINK